VNETAQIKRHQKARGRMRFMEGPYVEGAARVSHAAACPRIAGPAVDEFEVVIVPHRHPGDYDEEM